MNTPNPNPKPQGWAQIEPRVRAHIAQMAPHHHARDGGRFLVAAYARIAELESENAILKASNEMAAEHMARGRANEARQEAELDALKNAIRTHRSAKYKFADATNNALYATLEIP